MLHTQAAEARPTTPSVIQSCSVGDVQGQSAPLVATHYPVGANPYKLNRVSW